MDKDDVQWALLLNTLFLQVSDRMDRDERNPHWLSGRILSAMICNLKSRARARILFHTGTDETRPIDTTGSSDKALNVALSGAEHCQ